MTTTPDEQRGSGIQGAREKMIGHGDGMVIPSKTPRQFVLQGGAAFNYFAVKATN